MDIVERLRHSETPRTLAIGEEAANEIKRLRAELAKANEDKSTLMRLVHGEVEAREELWDALEPLFAYFHKLHTDTTTTTNPAKE